MTGTSHIILIINAFTKGSSLLLYNLHPESVNALRVFTLMRKGKVEILSRAVIIGGGKSRVNTDSRGCIYVKVFPDGSLGEMGSSNTCKTYSRHPDCGYLFSEMKLPHIDKCDALVKSCHPVLMHHRLLSWDVTLNEDGEAVLIEVNLTLGSSADIQIVNGPFFGPYTKEILDEVYGSGRT